MSLIEALNGPCTLRAVACQDVGDTPNSESAAQAAEMLNRSETFLVLSLYTKIMALWSLRPLPQQCCEKFNFGIITIQ